MKKFISLFTLVLVALTLQACGLFGNDEQDYDPDNFNETGFPIVDEMITLRFFAPRHPLHHPDGFNAMRLFKEMEEITNIRIEWIYGPTQTYAERRALTWQSRNKPDAFFLWNPIDEQIRYGPSGILRPLNDLIDQYAPNYKALLDENPHMIRTATLADGNMYSTVITSDVPRDQTFKQYINQTWLDNLGLSIPTTIEEYYQVLRAFKYDDPNQTGIPDTIPLSSPRLNQTRNFLMSAFGYVSTGIEVNNDEVVFVPSTDNYKAYLEFTRRLFAEGLLDNSVYTMDDRALAAKGSLVGSFDHAAAYLVVGTQRDADYVAIPPLTSEINATPMWLGFNTTSASGLVIPMDTPYYREIMRWIDFLYSEEGIRLQAFGKEGLDWQWDDEEETSFTFNVPTGIDPEQFRGTITPGVGLGTVAFWSADFVLRENNPLIQRINTNVDNAGYIEHLKIPFPNVIFTQEENMRLAILRTDLNIYMQVFEENIVTGRTVLNETTWNNHLNNLQNLRIDEFVAIHQAAYDRYMSTQP